MKIKIISDKRKFLDIYDGLACSLLAVLFYIPFVNFFFNCTHLDLALFYPIGIMLAILWILRGGGHLQLGRAELGLSLFFLYLTIRLAVIDHWLLLSDRYTCLALLPVVYGAFREFKCLPLIVSFIFAGLLQNLLGFCQLFGILRNADIYFPVGGSFGNPAVYGGYLVTLVPLALMQLMRTSQNNRYGIVRFCRWLCFLFLASTLILLPITGSRSSWLAAIIGVVAVFGYYQRFRPFKRVKKGMLPLAFLVVLVPLTWLLYQYKPDSAKGRILVWKVITRMFVESPAVGLGFTGFEANYTAALGRYFETSRGVDAAEWEVADNTSTAFNEFIEMAVEEGIVGVALFMAALILVFRRPGHGPSIVIAKVRNLSPPATVIG